ncbi:growth arrest and DNA damage-inducible protein GADD45 beta-like [Scleropages formosus]|uniref:Growth arrest and DNA damage inducible beta n=1 Tax=Scleropages formosus TaxID=113540 RepID=A0A8C9SVA8_SCLFO|nr:growth arrest and DNA damage-inducible protein GADD45 beta-like [Scleropages formosus]
MENVGQSLEELLLAAQRQDCLTVGIYESAELMIVDPDSVVLCVLATDEEDEDDIALQIHFTLIQAFFWDNDIDLLRVSGLGRLAQVLGEPSTANSNANKPRDLHCILVRSPEDAGKWPALKEVRSYCQESRRRNQWAPFVALQDR